MTDAPTTPATPEPTNDLTPKDPSPSPEATKDPTDVIDPAPTDPDPNADPAKDEAAPKDPDPADARLTVPEAPEGYTVNLDDDAKASLGLVENDPMVSALAKFAHENGKPQGWLDDALEAASALAKQGMFDGGFDPAAETQKLGENGAARQREVEVFAESLKARGDIDEEMFGDLMSLAPTAGGVRLVEFFRKQAGATAATKIEPKGSAVDKSDALEKAREMRRDPRYDKDRVFRAKADRAFKEAASQ